MTIRPEKQLHGSIFVKLLVLMLTMSVVILLMVVGFAVTAAPTLQGSVEGVTEAYVELLASTSPDLPTARRAGQRLDMAVRHEGPGGDWSTDEGLPSIAQVRRASNRTTSSFSRRYYVVTADNGSSYLFAMALPDRMSDVHDKLLLLLIALLASVFLGAYIYLRRALLPIRWLHRSVIALSEGNLEVSVPKRTHDELGVLTDAFNQMVGRVGGMVKSRDQLLLDVSHELRSPLTRMKVALELCPENPQKERLAVNVAEMEAMVSELLELERLRQGRGLELAKCDLVGLILDVTTASQGRPPGVVVGEAPAQLALVMDAEKIRTVLNNLLDNAIKYSLADSRPVRVSIKQDPQGVLVIVDDDGAGIPEKELPRLFEPFFRVDRSRSRHTGGYGLGLSLCRRIMQAHGGDIAVESVGSRGTTFVLRFPSAAEEASRP